MALPAFAQRYPARNVEIVVPFPAGAVTDLTARSLAEGIAKSLGQSVVVLNKDGAAGTNGTSAVAAAPADGYTLGFSAMGTVAGQPHLRSDLRYNAASFDYICQVTATFTVVLVSAESAYTSLKALFDDARQKPDKLTYGHPGPGSIPHLQMLDLTSSAGASMTSVPFRGEGPARTALLGKHIDAVMSGDAATVGDKLRPLAIVGSERIASLPNVPSTRELGFGEGFTTPFGLFAPKGLPADALSALRSSCDAAAKSENFRAAMTKSGQEIRYLDGPAFAAQIARHSEMIGTLIRKIGVPKN